MNSRKGTRYPGVQARESKKRRHNGRPDVCYTIDYRDAAGNRIRKDIGWASEGFSAAYAAKVRAQLILDSKTQALGVAPPAPQLTLMMAWERYKTDWLIANGKEWQHAQSMVHGHLAPIADTPLSKITAYELDQIMASMRRDGRSPQTVRHVIALVRRIMRRMRVWGLYDGPLPFDAITMPQPNNSRERYLTPDEARRLLEALRQRSETTWLMALISLMCGLRFGEVAALRHGDIRRKEGLIYIRESKNGKARHAVMPDAVCEALCALPAGGYDDLLFPGKDGGRRTAISDTFWRVVDSLGLNRDSKGAEIRDRRLRVVFHTLRHTYASWLAMQGEGEIALASLLGHSSTAMTRRYAHLMHDARRATGVKMERMLHAGPPDGDDGQDA